MQLINGSKLNNPKRFRFEDKKNWKNIFFSLFLWKFQVLIAREHCLFRIQSDSRNFQIEKFKKIYNFSRIVFSDIPRALNSEENIIFYFSNVPFSSWLGENFLILYIFSNNKYAIIYAYIFSLWFYNTFYNTFYLDKQNIYPALQAKI